MPSNIFVREPEVQTGPAALIERKDEFVANLQGSNRRVLRTHLQLEKALYEDPNFTPKEMIESLGDEAKKILAYMDRLAAAVRRSRPRREYARPAGWDIVYDENGAATVTFTEPAPEA